MSLPAVKEQPSSTEPQVSQIPDLPAIIARYINGEPIDSIAKEVGTARRTIYNWMLTELGKDHYEQVVTEALVSRIADADGELEVADSLLHIARAREKMRYSRMDFERRRPHLYGPKQEVKHTGVAPSLHISVVQAPQSALQHELPGSVTIEHDPK